MFHENFELKLIYQSEFFEKSTDSDMFKHYLDITKTYTESSTRKRA